MERVALVGGVKFERRFERLHMNSLGCTTTGRLAGIELMSKVRWLGYWDDRGWALVGDDPALDTTL